MNNTDRDAQEDPRGVLPKSHHPDCGDARDVLRAARQPAPVAAPAGATTVEPAEHTAYCRLVNDELLEALAGLPASERAPGDTAYRCACGKAREVAPAPLEPQPGSDDSIHGLTGQGRC